MSGNKSQDDPMTALAELFSHPLDCHHEHLRYRIDGPTEIEGALDLAFREAFGPSWNRKRKLWVRRLYRLGLIDRPASHVNRRKVPRDAKSRPR
jgi:hypothetical protein